MKDARIYCMMSRELSKSACKTTRKGKLDANSLLMFTFQILIMAVGSVIQNNSDLYFIMQAVSDEKLGPTMLLPLAERMTQKYVDENKIDAEAGMAVCTSQTIYLLIE